MDITRHMLRSRPKDVGKDASKGSAR
jgi:hypothetical protein